MDFIGTLGNIGIIAIAIAIILLCILINLIRAVFQIRDNTERSALVLEAIAKNYNITLPTEYTKNFKDNHY